MNPIANHLDLVTVSLDSSTVSLDATRNTQVLYGANYSISQDPGFTYTAAGRQLGLSGDMYVSEDMHITGRLDLGWYLFPAAAPGDNEIIKYDAATATLGWEADAGGGGGAPGGSEPQLQYNEGGAFQGDAGLTYDDTANDLGVSGDAWINTNLYVTGDANVTGKIRSGWVQASRISSDADIQSVGSILVSGDSNVTGITRTAWIRASRVSSDTHIQAVNNLYVSGDSNTTGYTRADWIRAGRVSSDADIQSIRNLYISGDSNISGFTLIDDSARVVTNLTTTGNQYVTGDMNTTGITRTAWIQASRISSDADIQGVRNLYISGDSNIAGFTLIDDSARVVSNFAVSGESSTTGNTRTAWIRSSRISSDAEIQGVGNLYVSGDANISGFTLIDDNLSVNDSLYVNNVANFGADDNSSDIYIHDSGGIWVYEDSDDFVAGVVCKDGAAEWEFQDDVNVGATTDAENLKVHNAGTIQALSAGDDKNIQITHNDTNGVITASDGTISFDNENLVTTGNVYVSGDMNISTATVLGTSLKVPQGTADSALTSAGQIYMNVSDDQFCAHLGTSGYISGEVARSFMQHFSAVFDPDAICDGSVDRVFLFKVGEDFPEGVTFDKWRISFEADPTTEMDTRLMRADNFIGVANAVTMDYLYTVSGVSNEMSAANINGGAAVAYGQAVFLEFGTTYTETGHQVIFEGWIHGEED